MPGARITSTAVIAIAAAAILSVPATAHVTKTSGPYRISIGWGNEPPIAGAPNSVEIEVSGEEGPGSPQPPTSLRVAVSFGPARTTLPLVPEGTDGTYRAPLVPTRPGTYRFGVEGTIGAQPVEVSSTCSEATFECVVPASEVSFPVKDPSVGELAERLSRELPRAEQSSDSADRAEVIAIAALAVAALTLAASLLLARRARRER